MLDIDMLAVVAFFVVVVEAELCTVCAVEAVVAEAGLIAVGSMVVVAAALEVAEQILVEQI